MGNVRSEKIKKTAHELLRRYPDRFTTNFEENKKIVQSLSRIPSTKLRNKIVGYLTRLVILSHSDKSKQTKPAETHL